MTDKPTAEERKAFDQLTAAGVPLGRDYKAVLDEGTRLRDAEAEQPRGGPRDQA